MRPHLSTLLSVFCLAVLFWPLSGLAATTNVNIVDFAFQPANVTIKVGDTVKWTNTGLYTHTTTGGTITGGARHPDGQWDSGSLSTGQTFSHIFTKAGAYPYYCNFHFPSMVGTVTLIKRIDKATPLLFQHCVDDRELPLITVQLTRADGQTFLKYELKNVMISSISHGGDLDGDGLPDETIVLTLGGAKLTYMQFDTKGKALGQTSAEW